MRRPTIAVGAVLGIALSGVLAAGVPASALDSSDIRVSALSVNQGSPIRVQVSYLYQATTCRVFVDGPKRTPVKTVRVRNGQIKTSFSTAALPTGSYVVRVACGKDGRAASDPVSIVPKGSPTRATCDVTDKGFGAGADGEVAYGIQVTNRSPALTAVSVKLAVTFSDASGNTIATQSEYVMDIPPGESVFEGGSDTVAGAASMRVDAVCDSSAERPNPRLRGQAQYIRPRDSDYYPTEFGGTIVNSTGFIIARFSDLEYVTRNAAGQISGGGSSYPDAFIPVGGTGTWESLSSLPTGSVTSVEWVLDPEAE